MADKKFESEIRILFDDVEPFLKLLNDLKARIIKTYSFKDHCYKPKGVQDWNLEEKIMRIREWNDKSQLLFTRTRIIRMNDVTFKQSLYPGGKIILHEGSLREIQQLLKDWNFEFWFLIEKEEGTLYEINDPFHLTLVVEKIKNLGHTAEFELWGENREEIHDEFHKIIKTLKIDPKKITSKPLPKLVHEQLVKKNFD